MTITRLRIAAVCALLPVALAVGGCQDVLTSPPGTTGGPTTPGTSSGNPQEIAQIQQTIDAEDYTAPGTVDSDFEIVGGTSLTSPSMGLDFGADSAGSDSLLMFHRIVLNSTRSRIVTQSGDSASVVITEDRSGTLKLGQRRTGVQLERPFADHGMRTATLVKRHGRWMVTASSFLDRASTSVSAPVHVDYVEFTPRDGNAMVFTDASQLLTRDAWPTMPVRTVDITVKISGAGEAGARVFLHDRYGEGVAEHHKMELVRDAADPTLFHGTWMPNPRREGEERAWRRLLTIDAFDATTLSLDASAAYNAHQWVVPVAFHRARTSGT